MHPAALRGLEQDGLQPEDAEPKLLTQEDLERAASVIVFCELPSSLTPRSAVLRWSVPPISEDYSASRSAIVGEIERFLGAG